MNFFGQPGEKVSLEKSKLHVSRNMDATVACNFHIYLIYHYLVVWGLIWASHFSMAERVEDRLNPCWCESKGHLRVGVLSCY